MNMGLAGDVINYISHIFLLLASYEILLWNSMLDTGRKTKIKREKTLYMYQVSIFASQKPVPATKLRTKD